jgi:hypothetical protein
MAAKDHRCDWCGGLIPRGTEYVVATEFPGGDAGYADAAGHPVRMPIHAEKPCHYCPSPDLVARTPAQPEEENDDAAD